MESNIDDDTTFTTFSNSMDISHIPLAMASDDGVEQEQVLRAIELSQSIQHGLERQFERQKIHSLPLATLKTWFDRGESLRVIQNLTQRCRLNIRRSIKNYDDPNLSWFCNHHFIDYILLVSARMGLHAIIPNTRHQPDYSFKLRLDQPFRTFHAKFAQLGFDPTRRMLYIGTVGNDQVWLAMAPNALNDVHDDIAMSGTTTSLETHHYLAIVAWLAFVMSQRGIRNIYSMDDYPVLTKDHLHHVTNLL